MQISRSSSMIAAPDQSAQRTSMSFDVDQRKHAMTVSVVDGRSGEILQKMVYDKRSAPGPAGTVRAGAGALVDVEA